MLSINDKIYFKLKKYKEHIMIFFAILAIVLLSIEFMVDIDEQTQQLFQNIDLIICAVFATEFFIRLKKVDRGKRLKYSLKNFIDIIAFIPFNRAFRLARLVRVTRIARLSRLSRLSRFTRLLRLVSFAKKFIADVKQVMKTNGLQYMLVFSSVTVLLGAIGMYFVELDNFKDALWWSFVTTTTVGYGDIVPTTIPGRIIASMLMLVGIGLVGMITSSLATYFIIDKQEDNENKNIKYIKEKIENVEELSKQEIKELKTMVNSFLEHKIEETEKPGGDSSENH